MSKQYQFQSPAQSQHPPIVIHDGTTFSLYIYHTILYGTRNDEDVPAVATKLKKDTFLTLSGRAQEGLSTTLRELSKHHLSLQFVPLPGEAQMSHRAPEQDLEHEAVTPTHLPTAKMSGQISALNLDEVAGMVAERQSSFGYASQPESFKSSLLHLRRCRRSRTTWSLLRISRRL